MFSLTIWKVSYNIVKHACSSRQTRLHPLPLSISCAIGQELGLKNGINSAKKNLQFILETLLFKKVQTTRKNLLNPYTNKATIVEALFRGISLSRYIASLPLKLFWRARSTLDRHARF